MTYIVAKAKKGNGDLTTKLIRKEMLEEDPAIEDWFPPNYSEVEIIGEAEIVSDAFIPDELDES